METPLFRFLPLFFSFASRTKNESSDDEGTFPSRITAVRGLRQAGALLVVAIDNEKK